MPGFDRTGPMGAGPMTGGARGLCNPATAGAVRAYGGYGYGRGLGRLNTPGVPATPRNQRGMGSGRGGGRGQGRGRSAGQGRGR